MDSYLTPKFGVISLDGLREMGLMDDGRPRHDLNSVTQAEIKRSMLYLEKGSIHYDYAATRVYLAHCSCETILCSWLTSRTV